MARKCRGLRIWGMNLRHSYFVASRRRRRSGGGSQYSFSGGSEGTETKPSDWLTGSD